MVVIVCGAGRVLHLLLLPVGLSLSPSASRVPRPPTPGKNGPSGSPAQPTRGQGTGSEGQSGSLEPALGTAHVTWACPLSWPRHPSCHLLDLSLGGGARLSLLRSGDAVLGADRLDPQFPVSKQVRGLGLGGGEGLRRGSEPGFSGAPRVQQQLSQCDVGTAPPALTPCTQLPPA